MYVGQENKVKATGIEGCRCAARLVPRQPRRPKLRNRIQNTLEPTVAIHAVTAAGRVRLKKEDSELSEYEVALGAIPSLRWRIVAQDQRRGGGGGGRKLGRGRGGKGMGGKPEFHLIQIHLRMEVLESGAGETLQDMWFVSPELAL